MTDAEIERAFRLGLVGVLGNWQAWMGDDALRAVHVGFDAFNAEIAVSLLTDREPGLAKLGLDPFSDGVPGWPVADWRLNGVNRTATHGFPDCADLLAWMARTSRSIDADDEAAHAAFNARLQQAFLRVLTDDAVAALVERFPNRGDAVRLRVHWFFGDSADAVLHARATADRDGAR